MQNHFKRFRYVKKGFLGTHVERKGVTTNVKDARTILA